MTWNSGQIRWMNIEAIIKAARDVVAARSAHEASGRSLDTWDVVCVAEHTLINLEGVPMPSEAGGALALAKLLVAAYDAGYDTGHGEGLDDGMNK